MCFALANFLDRREPKRTEYLANIRAAQRRDIPVLLDNGAWEFGKSINCEQYLDIIEILKPSDVIIPDVIKAKNPTLEIAYEFMTLWEDMDMYTNLPRLYFAPQGANYNEIKECYESFMDTWSASVYGLAVPKHIGKWANRIDLINLLYSQTQIHLSHVHLLGYNGMEEFGNIDPIGYTIDSIDTRFPIKSLIPEYSKLSQIQYYTLEQEINMVKLTEAAEQLHKDVAKRFSN